MKKLNHELTIIFLFLFSRKRKILKNKKNKLISLSYRPTKYTKKNQACSFRFTNNPVMVFVLFNKNDKVKRV